MVSALFNTNFEKHNNVYLVSNDADVENQKHTNKAFSNKWDSFSQEEMDEQEKFYLFQKDWYLRLYGFESEDDLRRFLQKQKVIMDAGCGLGYKAKWFAELAPESQVIGIDYSDAAFIAAERNKDQDNLSFIKGDIADTHIKDGSIDYISCDQVIHHTQDPQKTFQELSRILAKDGEMAVYVYAKKALPRELIDDYFRERSKTLSHEELMEFSEQLTILGERLSAIDTEIDIPAIPLLDIKEQKTTVQRFIYWNFLKCFWNEDMGRPSSVSINYDWYAPSNAYRYTIDEFMDMAHNSGMMKKFIHTEEACHSGRFVKR